MGTADRQRDETLEDIGVLHRITAGGFGFARCLTGDRTREVFLNQTRIAHLGDVSLPTGGVLITMRTSQQPDGRWSATRAARLDPAAPVATQLARLHLGRQIGEAAAATAAAPVPQLLSGTDPLVDDQLLAVAQLRPDMGASWARAVIDRDASTPGSTGSSARTAWWDVLENAIASGLSPDEDWLDWPSWERAPAKVARSALARWNSKAAKDLFAAIEVLDHAIAQSTRIGRVNARTQLASLDARDRQLADLWVPPPVGPNSNPIAEAVRAQMWTARAAEKSAAAYFAALGLSVEDVAIEQLRSADGDWQSMDLRIDGRHGIDVKNLRRTFHGGMQSSRWKIKAFKLDAAGAKVTLCGVSSPYTRFSDGQIACEQDEDMRVLGVTTVAEVSALARRFTAIFALRTHPLTRLIELPPWAWDYPNAQYKERDLALSSFQAELPALRATALGRRCLAMLPAVFFSYWDVEAPHAEQLSPQQRDYLEHLRVAFAEERRTGKKAGVPRLPWLYLFTLHLWASWRARNVVADSDSLLKLFQWHAHSREDAAQADAAIRERIERLRVSEASEASSDEPDDMPLGLRDLSRSVAESRRLPSKVAGSGLVDPADSLAGLLGSLSVLEKHLTHAQFITLSDVTHTYSGVLVGTFPDGQRKTLLAHCCGRLSNNVECGNRPLVFGRERTCVCGRLICGKCSTCTDTRYGHCEQQSKRMATRRAVVERTSRTGRRSRYR